MGKGHVSRRALHQRINRKLNKQDEKLIKSRRGKEKDNFGEYYIINTLNNSVIAQSLDLVTLGGRLGVMTEGESFDADRDDVMNKIKGTIKQIDDLQKEYGK